MRSLIDKLYFFVVICANANTLSILLGEHAALKAGRNASALSDGSSNPALLAINASLAIATAIMAFPKLPQMFAMLSRFKPLTALYSFAAVSLLWSSDRSSTLRSGIYLFMYLIFAAYIALRFENEEIIRLLGSSMAILGLASIPGQYLLPHNTYLQGHWSGIFQQKNELGSAMAVGLVALIAAKGQGRLFRMVSILVCASLLVLSQSVTALLAAAAAVIALFYTQFSGRMRPIFVTAVAAGVAALSIAVSNFSNLFSNTTGRDLSFSGRTAVWSVVVTKIEARPLLGYGYSAFWSSEGYSVDQFLNWKPGQAHNGFLEISLSLGIVGLVLVLLVATAALVQARHLRKTDGDSTGVWLAAVTVLLLLHNVAESDFLLPHITWFVFLLAYLSLWRIEHGQIDNLIEDEVAFEDEGHLCAGITSQATGAM